jgi:hypothetical protein
MNVVFGGYRFSSLARTPLVGTQLPVALRFSPEDSIGAVHGKQKVRSSYLPSTTKEFQFSPVFLGVATTVHHFSAAKDSAEIYGN